MNFIEALPPDPQSARRARRFVREQLTTVGVDSEGAEHVVSELVANVAEHARTTVHVAVVVSDSVRIEVYDGNAVIPAVIDAAADAERGRGLAIVEAYANTWGVTPTGDGKMVWAELERLPLG